MKYVDEPDGQKYLAFLPFVELPQEAHLEHKADEAGSRGARERP